MDSGITEKAKKQERKMSVLLQSPGISCQFASPLTSKRCHTEGTNTMVKNKRIKFTCQDKNDGNIDEELRKSETRNLKVELKKKEDLLRKLKLVKMYRQKNNLTDLEDVIVKWRSVSQKAAQDLYEKFNEGQSLSMGDFLHHLRLDHKLIQYCEEDEIFY